MFRICTIVALSVALLTVALPVPARAQAAVAGAWNGTIHVMGQNLEIQVNLTSAEGWKGNISIPVQGAMNLALTNIKVDGTSLHFELPTGGAVAIFDGTLSGDAITGTFDQGGVKGTFDLKRGEKAAPAPAVSEPPPPYRQEEVSITNGVVKLAGTLTLPAGAGPHPVVILITGSGAQDRDETIVGFKIFRVIADHLTRQGLAVLRCDDRGVGGSTGSVSDATSEDFAGDVLADITFLKTRPDIDAKRIGLLGHSEGGLIAPMVASRSNDVAFIVLLSGPALTGEKIMVLQGERLMKAGGATAELLARQAHSQQRLFDVARGKATVEEVKREFSAQAEAQAASMPEEARKNLMTMAASQLDAQIKSVQSRWFRFFLDYDPAPALAKVKCPVLALFGELDLQVPTDANKPVMDQIFAKSGNRNATTRVFAKANHLYQEAKTGTATEYATLKKEFVPDLLPAITTWIKQQAGKGSD
ncbi:MAG: alpha/beta hydrolase family protein [Bacteroidales bacterium]